MCLLIFYLLPFTQDNELRVIECYMRVSRPFPFVAKTLDHDFIAMSTRVIVGQRIEPVNVLRGCDKIDVKAPQFPLAFLAGSFRFSFIFLRHFFFKYDLVYIFRT